MKYLKLSRAAFIIGFALSDQLEKVWYQYTTLYSAAEFLHRPVAVSLFVVTIAVAVWGLFFNRTKISYV